MVILVGAPLSRISSANMPSAAVVNTKLAINDKAIIAAEYIPKLLNNPIGDNAITLNPAISDAALPMSAKLQAPPTATNAS